MGAFDREMKSLLNALDRVIEKHEEVGDTAVREAMFAAVFDGFLKPQPGYLLPPEFGMFSKAGNAAVHKILARFIEQAEAAARQDNLMTPQQRLDAFQGEVESNDGNGADEYFGYCDGIE